MLRTFNAKGQYLSYIPNIKEVLFNFNNILNKQTKILGHTLSGSKD